MDRWILPDVYKRQREWKKLILGGPIHLNENVKNDKDK